MPLNTAREFSRIQLDRVIELICLMAVLAVQNLEGAQVFDKNSDQAVEYAALEGSLQMMSQVLNVRFFQCCFSPNSRSDLWCRTSWTSPACASRPRSAKRPLVADFQRFIGRRVASHRSHDRSPSTTS